MDGIKDVLVKLGIIVLFSLTMIFTIVKEFIEK